MMRSDMRWTVGFFVAALGLGMVGCSTGGGSGDPEPAVAPGVPGEGVRMSVKNDQRIEANIFVFLDGAQQRVGRISAFGEDSFLVPMDRGRVVRFEFRLFGGPTCVTREISMVPGDVVSYTIPVDLQGFIDATCRGGP
jgi:hypothetical protein